MPEPGMVGGFLPAADAHAPLPLVVRVQYLGMAGREAGSGRGMRSCAERPGQGAAAQVPAGGAGRPEQASSQRGSAGFEGQAGRRPAVRPQA